MASNVFKYTKAPEPTYPASAPPSEPSPVPTRPIIPDMPTLPSHLPTHEKLKIMFKHLGTQFTVGTKNLVWNLSYANQLRNLKRPLSRSEFNLLQKTKKDAILLVPFGILFMIPFSTLILPVYIAKLPTLVPSTFFSAKQIYELRDDLLDTYDVRRSSVRGEVSYINARCTPENKEIASELGRELRVHTREDVERFRPLFDRELNIEQMEDARLYGLADYLGFPLVNVMPERVLRNYLTRWAKKISMEDSLIDKEGIESLSEEDITKACFERRIPGNKESLQQWLTSMPRLDQSNPSKTDVSVITWATALFAPVQRIISHHT